MRKILFHFVSDPDEPQQVLDFTEKVSKYATLMILGGIIIELFQPLYKQTLPDYETSIAFVANAMIAIGLYAEFVIIDANGRAAEIIKSVSDQKIADANAKASDANERAVVATLMLEQERARNAPRFLTAAQIEAITKNVNGKITKITFVVQRGLEPRNFMWQLSGVFNQMGCQTGYVEMLPGSYTHYPAGVAMYMPGGAISEDQLKGDPLYAALKEANLFGGFTAKPLSDPDTLSFDRLLRDDEHIIYIGQKNSS